MVPPEAPDSDAGNQPPAVSVCLQTLVERADFLRAARAQWKAMPSMVVQARDRKDGEATVRVGFTCSKKVGNAVARNRAKRRLREVARAVLPDAARPGWDYVLIGRANVTAALPFETLKSDLRTALTHLHNKTK
ncbi:ribonuclease P protein component [Roseovarius litoreus]|uniref:Ribonuclease P protein component n=1 Tax=Roseovarius litoreus TaxID=1155722 RepID=A0A1M7GRK3_9RHOB|nr:ribonuclease P protein component [Roseovarius litoreus]SHM18778.1 ribonuclease P protein component [Roseovarius litoreus]